MSEFIGSKYLAHGAPRLLDEHQEIRNQWHSVAGLLDEVEGDAALESQIADDLEILAKELDQAEQAWNASGQEDQEGISQVDQLLERLEDIHLQLSNMLSEEPSEE